MATPKQDLQRFLETQPEDVSREELIRELAFELMVQRGVADSDTGRTMSNAEIQRRIASWQQQ